MDSIDNKADSSDKQRNNTVSDIDSDDSYSAESDISESKHKTGESSSENAESQRTENHAKKQKINYAEMYRLYISFLVMSIGVAVLIILIIRMLG